MKVSIYGKKELEKHSYIFESTELCEIMGKHGSDKGNEDLARSHNYTTVYHKLFKKLKNQPINFFELGLGTNNESVPSHMTNSGQPGASLHGWSKFFPYANVFGADIDKGILFQTDRVKTFYCDQTNPKIIDKMWSSDALKNIEFDIIIEDGYHEHAAQICFFENSIHKLKSGGYYVIEDFNHGTPFKRMCSAFENFQDQNKYPDLIVEIYQLPATSEHHKKNGNNGLVIIKKK